MDDLLSIHLVLGLIPTTQRKKKKVPKSKGTVANHTDTPERTGSMENLVKMMP